MPQIKTNAIVIGRADYRENDRMLTLFSPNRGRIDAIARRAKSQKSPLLSASELFCSGEYVLYEMGDHATVVSCQVTDAYYPLREDYDRFSHGALMLEMCRNVVQPDQENERLFLLLLRSLAYLTYGPVDPQAVCAVFMMGFLSLNGYRPRVGRCLGCGTLLEVGGNADIPAQPKGSFSFSPSEGGILCRACKREDEIPLTEEDVRNLQLVMHAGLDALDQGLVISDAVFRALKAMVKERMDATFRSEKILAKGVNPHG